jgi:hypothetical protein
MSRPFARRLAAMALLAVLCLALPAAAAAPRHTAKAPATAPSFLDELLIWIGSFLGGPPQARAEGRAKVATAPTLSTTSDLSTSSMDASIGVDPNGHS